MILITLCNLKRAQWKIHGNIALSVSLNVNFISVTSLHSEKNNHQTTLLTFKYKINLKIFDPITYARHHDMCQYVIVNVTSFNS